MTILIATDLSSRSDRALDRAALLARDLGLPLAVVHVVDDELSPQAIAAQSETANRAIRDRLSALPAGAPAAVDIDVSVGTPHGTVIRAAAARNARLVVLGTHRHHAVKDLFRGTTAARIIRDTAAPILMVSDHPSHAYARAVVGVDFSVFSRTAITTAARLFPTTAFRLAHAYEVPFAGFQYGKESHEEAREQHRQALRRMVADEVAPALAGMVAPGMVEVVQRGSPLTVLCQEVKAFDADLLVVGTHGRTGLAHMLLGSVAEELLTHPPCDLLVVPTSAAEGGAS